MVEQMLVRLFSFIFKIYNGIVKWLYNGIIAWNYNKVLNRFTAGEENKASYETDNIPWFMLNYFR